MSYPNWKKGVAYSNGGQDWHRQNITIHDNGWGTIQICVLHGVKEKHNEYREASTLFACVEYFSGHRGTCQSTMCQFNHKQAFDAAIAMCDGLIAVNFDLGPAIDHNPEKDENESLS